MALAADEVFFVDDLMFVEDTEEFLRLLELDDGVVLAAGDEYRDEDLPHVHDC